MFESRVLRRIIGSQRDEVEEEFHNLYSSPNITRIDQVKKNELGGACSTNEGEEECI
jgi:hypothetical protein